MSSLSPAPHRGSPETVPVPAVGPRTFGGDLWHSVAPLCGGAILPEFHLGLLHTSAMLPVGNSHAGAHPSDASALCQMLLQDAGPTSVLRLHTPPRRPCHKCRRGDTVTAWPVLPAAHYDAGTAACCPPCRGRSPALRLGGWHCPDPEPWCASSTTPEVLPAAPRAGWPHCQMLSLQSSEVLPVLA